MQTTNQTILKIIQDHLQNQHRITVCNHSPSLSTHTILITSLFITTPNKQHPPPRLPKVLKITNTAQHHTTASITASQTHITITSHIHWDRSHLDVPIGYNTTKIPLADPNLLHKITTKIQQIESIIVTAQKAPQHLQPNNRTPTSRVEHCSRASLGGFSGPRGRLLGIFLAFWRVRRALGRLFRARKGS